ncbi:UNVERIFIED_CONTAM: hypothetical protein Sradi_4385500 [Sesamum radiatum]|uniref:Uncharacterized protein n=1 Tax=Sesamum radiatum TaxID=300843 RepID=A0AAW2NNS7_SESRA
MANDDEKTERKSDEKSRRRMTRSRRRSNDRLWLKVQSTRRKERSRSVVDSDSPEGEESIGVDSGGMVVE